MTCPKNPAADSAAEELHLEEAAAGDVDATAVAATARLHSDFNFFKENLRVLVSI